MNGGKARQGTVSGPRGTEVKTGVDQTKTKSETETETERKLIAERMGVVTTEKRWAKVEWMKQNKN